MIPRYSRPEMQEIWSEKSKFQIWLDIEVHACDALAKLGLSLRKRLRLSVKKLTSTLMKLTRLKKKQSMM